VWGFPRPIHVFPGDAPPGDHLVRLRNGKRKAALPNAAPASKAVKSTLVVLERGSALAIERIDARAAVDALMTLDSGFDLLRAESEQAAQALASAGAWRLTL